MKHAPIYLAIFITSLLSLTGLFTVLLDVFSYLWSSEDSIIAINRIGFYLLFIGSFFIGIIYLALKQNWNLASFSVPSILLLTFTMIVVTSPTPDTGDLILPDEEVDAYFVINSMIKPWIYNITLADGHTGQPRDCIIEDIIEKLEKSPTELTDQCNDLNSSEYLSTGIEDYKGKVNLSVLHLSLREDRSESEFIILGITTISIDTEHGITFPVNENPDGVPLSYTGQPVEITSPQFTPRSFFLKIPNKPARYMFRCSFFCGAGHFGMTLPLIVK